MKPSFSIARHTRLVDALIWYWEKFPGLIIYLVGGAILMFMPITGLIEDKRAWIKVPIAWCLLHFASISAWLLVSATYYFRKREWGATVGTGLFGAMLAWLTIMAAIRNLFV